VNLAAALADAAAGRPAPPDVKEPDTRARKALAAFHRFLQGMLAARTEFTVPDLLALLLKESGYVEWLRDGTAEGESRWENVRELRGVAEDFAAYAPEEGLAAMLESVALVSDVDGFDAAEERVKLLTLHSAKGLEFDSVFIAGLEEGYLPHTRSIEAASDIEEERRLFYVGLTRARREVVLTRAVRRSLFGQPDTREPSRFLADLPDEVLESGGATAAERGRPRPPERTVWTTRRSSDAATSPAVVGFRPGDKVSHVTFGEGVVVTSAVRNGDEEVTVAFANAGVKKLLQSFARLAKR
jgi:DNA helicase-2/ATP-dependent DNA helicase PcrA